MVFLYSCGFVYSMVAFPILTFEVNSIFTLLPRQKLSIYEMSKDKELYRNSLEQYRQWHEAELIEHIVFKRRANNLLFTTSQK